MTFFRIVFILILLLGCSYEHFPSFRALSLARFYSYSGYYLSAQSDILAKMRQEQSPSFSSTCNREQNSNNKFPNFESYLIKYYPSILANYYFYDRSQILYRQYVYNSNLRLIREHNSNPNRTYTMAVNKFAILHLNQFQKMYLSPLKRNSNVYVYKSQPKVMSIQKSSMNNDRTNLQSLGLRKPEQKCDQFTIFDQRTCGSCYAVATLDSIYLNIGSLNQTFFSIYEILACGPGKPFYQLKGCRGGTIESTFSYIINQGITRVGVSFQQQDNYGKLNQLDPTNCSKGSRYPFDKPIKTYVTINDCQNLKLQIFNYYTVSYTNLPKESMLYNKGDIIGRQTSNDYNHAVVVMKWNFQDTYKLLNNVFYIKNSWGSNWGMGGFAYLDSSTGVCDHSFYAQ